MFEHAGTTTGTDISGARGDVQLARVSAFEIAGTRFTGHTIAITDLPDGPGVIDAVVGFPTIAQARWTVDVPAGRWSIER